MRYNCVTVNRDRLRRYNCITVLRESIRRDITVSQSIEMAVRITMTVLQSIEKAVRRDILCHTVNRDTSGGIKLCHSQ